MGQFSNSVAAHPRTNKVEVTPPGYYPEEIDKLLDELLCEKVGNNGQQLKYLVSEDFNLLNMPI